MLIAFADVWTENGMSACLLLTRTCVNDNWIVIDVNNDRSTIRLAFLVCSNYKFLLGRIDHIAATINIA